MDLQLCWKCSKTNELNCSWFADHILPKGAKVNDRGFIISCPYFKGARTQSPNEIMLICLKYKISKRTVYRYMERYGERFLFEIQTKYSKNR